MEIVDGAYLKDRKKQATINATKKQLKHNTKKKEMKSYKRKYITRHTVVVLIMCRHVFFNDVVWQL